MFERYHDVLPSDVWANGLMKPRRLVDCLQDTADIGCREIEADTQTVLARGYAWVLVHSAMSVSRWAELGERIAIRTWHNVTDGLYTYRAFDVRDAHGRQLADGATSWILIDLARGRPVKAKQNLSEKFVADGAANPDVVHDFRPLPRDIDGSAREKIFEVRVHDLDSNDHVNNAVYIEWAVEAVPEKYALEKKLAGWEVEYRKSAHFGDSVSVKTQQEGDSFTSLILSRDTFLCSVRTHWE